MKHILYTLLFLSVSISAFSQSQDLLQRVMMNHTLRRLSYEKKYDSIIAVAGKLPFRDSVYMYGTEAFVADAYLMKGDTTKAMRYLTKAIENQDVKAVENLKYMYGDYHLENNKEYKYIVQHFDELHGKYNRKLNMALMQQCLEIYYTDSRMRFLWMEATGAHDTATQRIADLLQWRSDSMNVNSMKDILRTYGRFPGMSDIGKTFSSNFIYIIAHWASKLDQDTLYKYLRTATLKGELPNWYGPHILDKTDAYYGKKLQAYGEFGNANNYKDDIYYYSDIRDIDSVDKRRAAFLLLPLYTELELKQCVLPKNYSPAKQKGGLKSAVKVGGG